jgi:hypothetical protein
MRVAALRIGAEPEEWRDLGFGVSPEGAVELGNARLELSASARRGEIGSWALEGEGLPEELDGLPTDAGVRGEPKAGNPNGALAIDHVVVVTPSLERTTGAFAEVGVECRRVREAGRGIRQGFFLFGDLLVEAVELTDADGDAPARFWGFTVAVADIDAAAGMLGERLGAVKDAVQPGRRIATVRPEASGGLPLALITQRKRGTG